MKQYHKNPRQISKRQLTRLEESLIELGDLSGVVHDLNSDEIIGGNMRSRIFDINACQVEIVKQYDEPDEQGTVAHGFILWNGKRNAYRQVRWTAEQCERANLAANSMGGSWDWSELPNWSAETLTWAGFDNEMLKWEKQNVTALGEFLKSEAPSQDAEVDTDRAAELLEKWQVKSGDMFQIGEHRLICGDCTDAATVARVMGGEKAKYLFTDPPYGIDYDPQFLPEIAERHNKRLSRNAKVANDNGELDLSFLFEYENRMIWGFPYIYDENATGWIVWDKQPGVESRGIVTPIEMASTTMRTGFDMVRVMWGGFYRAAGEDQQPHPTQKPLGVYFPFIDRWTKEGELIYDPFSGSAPVMVVSENLKRRCYAAELDPAYVAVALERMSLAFPGIEIKRIE